MSNLTFDLILVATSSSYRRRPSPCDTAIINTHLSLYSKSEFVYISLGLPGVGSIAEQPLRMAHSSYYYTLPAAATRRYNEKISSIGYVDPYSINNDSFSDDVDTWSRIC